MSQLNSFDRRAETSRRNGQKGGRPKVLSPSSQAIAKYLYQQAGYSVSELSTKLGVSKRSLYRVCEDWSSPILRIAIEDSLSVPGRVYLRGQRRGQLGFDIQLGKLLALILNRRCLFVPVKFSQVLSAVKTGQCDLAISALSDTPGRRLEVHFSDSYSGPRSAGIRFFSLREFVGRHENELAPGTVVGCLRGTLHESYLRESPELRLSPRPFSQRSQIETALRAGRVQAWLTHRFGLTDAIAKHRDLVALAPEPTYGQFCSVAVAHGNGRLGEEINKSLKAFRSLGILDLFRLTFQDSSLTREEFEHEFVPLEAAARAWASPLIR